MPYNAFILFCFCLVVCFIEKKFNLTLLKETVFRGKEITGKRGDRVFEKIIYDTHVMMQVRQILGIQSFYQ